MAKMAKTIFLGYESAKDYFPGKNTILSGNPVSDKLFEGNREKVIKDLQLDPEKPILLVMGGSQGARQINDCIYPNLEALQNWNIIHLTGKGELPKLFKHPHYHAYEYVTNEYANFLNTADLVISRAGGNSLAEIEALQKTALLIPLPLPAAAGDHQRKNALEMLKKHPRWQMLYGEEVTPEKVLESINTLHKNRKIAKKTEKHTEKPQNIVIRELKKIISEE